MLQQATRSRSRSRQTSGVAREKPELWRVQLLFKEFIVFRCFSKRRWPELDDVYFDADWSKKLNRCARTENVSSISFSEFKL